MRHSSKHTQCSKYILYLPGICHSTASSRMVKNQQKLSRKDYNTNETSCSVRWCKVSAYRSRHASASSSWFRVLIRRHIRALQRCSHHKRTVTFATTNWTQYCHLGISQRYLIQLETAAFFLSILLRKHERQIRNGFVFFRGTLPLPPSLERHSWSIECHRRKFRPPPDLGGTCLNLRFALDLVVMGKMVSRPTRPRTKIRWISLSLNQIHWQVSYDKPFMHSHLGNTISFFASLLLHSLTNK
jgi:hypothetical protein